MLRSPACWVALHVVLLSCAVWANPKPDAPVKEMNDLARAYPAGLSEEQVGRLADLMGRYHFRFWEPDVRDLVASRLDEYTPVLLACQGTTHAIDFELHRWYRAIASENQKTAMCAVLRGWLTDEISRPPPDGSMRLVEFTSGASGAIMAGRVKAAEVLSDYGDTTAAPLMRAVLESLKSSVRWFLRQALRRLRDPAAASVWVRGSDGGTTLVRDLSTADRAMFGYQGVNARWPVEVDAETSERVMDLIARVEFTNARAGYDSLVSFRLYFPDGVYAEFALSDGPILIYRDNTRIEGPRRTLVSAALWQQLDEMRQSDYGGYTENW